MNRHIFTQRETEVLTDWMTGRASREDNGLLHVTLNRLRVNEKQLTQQVKFYALAIRRLHHGRLRKRADDNDFTLTLMPMRLRPSGVAAYTLCVPRIIEAQRTANDGARSQEERLEAMEMIVGVAKIMIKDQKRRKTGDPTS